MPTPDEHELHMAKIKPSRRASVKGVTGPLTDDDIKSMYSNQSCFVFSPDSGLRKSVIRLVHSKPFEWTSVFVILVNCCFLAASNPLDKDESSQLNSTLDASEYVFTVLFTIEMLLKIICMGFILDSGSYLRDGWNWLDFTVVIIGYVSFIPGVANLSALRTFRVLRPLRTLTTIPGMRVIVMSLISSVPALMNVALLCVFIFFIFGIVGVQLWAGVLQPRCFYPTPGELPYLCTGDGCDDRAAVVSAMETSLGIDLSSKDETVRLVDEEVLCACNNDVVLAGGKSECDVEAFDGAMAGQTCAEAFKDFHLKISVADGNATVGWRCHRYENPGYGFIGFDNIGMACLTIFTSITLEGWVDVMYNLNATFGHQVVTVPYFVLMIALGSFFLLNLALAVIWDEYSKAEEEIAKKDAEALQNLQLNQPEGDADGGAGKQKEPERHWSCDNSFSLKCLDIVEGAPFNAIIVVFIVLNTIVMALEHYGMSEAFELGLCYMNVVFTFVFLSEMVIKLIGLGPRGYVQDHFNTFDGIIVIFSIVELVFEVASVGLCGGGKTGLAALRSFRLLRVFKLARSWKDLRQLLTTIIESIAGVSNAAVVLFVIMFIFSLLGMQLFGGKFGCVDGGDGPEAVTSGHDCLDKNGDPVVGVFDSRPRAHFDDLWWSFVTVFQVLTGENWNDVIVIGMHAAGTAQSVIYFVVLNLVGNYMILNLFLAILLGNFDADEEEEEEDNEDVPAAPSASSAAVAPVIEEEDRESPQPGSSPGDNASGGSLGDADDADAISKDLVPVKPAPEDLVGTSLFIFGPSSPVRILVTRLIHYAYFDNFILVLIGVSSVLLALDSPAVEVCQELPEGHPDNCTALAAFLKGSDIFLTACFVIELVLKVIAMGFVLGNGTYLKNAWNILDFVIVIVSVISVAADGAGGVKALRSLRAFRALRPLRVISRNPGMKLVVNSIFRSLPAVFNVSCVAFLFFLIFGIVGVQNWMGAMNRCNDPSVKCPPVSAVCPKGGCTKSNHDEWKVAPGFLGWSGGEEGGPSCGEDCVVVGGDDPLTCYDLYLDEDRYADSGVLCQGKFNLAAVGQCALAKSDYLQYQCEHGTSVTVDRQWHAPGYNFDNVGAALLTIYEVASGEMWPDIMYDTVDAVAYDAPMQFQYNTAAALYYIFVTIVCAFIMIELFTGVVIDNFNEMKKEAAGSGLLTDEQKLWVESKKLALSSKPLRDVYRPPGTAPFSRGWCFNLIQTDRFEATILTLIMLNVMTMALRYDQQPSSWTTLLEVCNLCFTIIFTIEMVIKLHALHLKEYAVESWNRFDGTLVILSWIGFAFDMGQYATLMRVARVARIFRLVKRAKGLLNLFKTLLFSIPSLVNVGAILMLLFFVFAVLGMTLFARNKHGSLLGDDANFQTFGLSLITLFRMSTGESYNGIMHDMRVEEPNCSPNVKCSEWRNVIDGDDNDAYTKLQEHDPWCGNFDMEYSNCGQYVVAPIYFVLFFTISAYMLLNLLVAIILDNFSDAVALDDVKVRPEDIEDFRRTWHSYDKKGTQYMKTEDLPAFLVALPFPLGLKGAQGIHMSQSKHRHARKLIKHLKLTDVAGRVSYQETLAKLTDFASGIEQGEVPDVPITQDLQKQLDKRMVSIKKKMSKHRGVAESSLLTVTTEEVSAAQEIQAVFRGKKAREDVRLRREAGDDDSAAESPEQKGDAADAAASSPPPDDAQ